jgi:hypothetical protein
MRASRPGYIDTPAWHATQAGEQLLRRVPRASRPAGPAPPTRSRRWSYSSHQRTAFMSLELNCLSMAATRKCRPLTAQSMSGGARPEAIQFYNPAQCCCCRSNYSATRLLRIIRNFVLPFRTGGNTNRLLKGSSPRRLLQCERCAIVAKSKGVTGRMLLLGSGLP